MILDHRYQYRYSIDKNGITTSLIITPTSTWLSLFFQIVDQVVFLVRMEKVAWIALMATIWVETFVMVGIGHLQLVFFVATSIFVSYIAKYAWRMTSIQCHIKLIHKLYKCLYKIDLFNIKILLLYIFKMCS